MSPAVMHTAIAMPNPTPTPTTMPPAPTHHPTITAPSKGPKINIHPAGWAAIGAGGVIALCAAGALWKKRRNKKKKKKQSQKKKDEEEEEGHLLLDITGVSDPQAAMTLEWLGERRAGRADQGLPVIVEPLPSSSSSAGAASTPTIREQARTVGDDTPPLPALRFDYQPLPQGHRLPSRPPSPALELLSLRDLSSRTPSPLRAGVVTPAEVNNSASAVRTTDHMLAKVGAWWKKKLVGA